MHIAKWKKAIWHGYLLHEFNHMTFWRKQRYRNSKNTSAAWVGGEGEGETSGWSTVSFRAVKLLCGTPQWRTHVVLHLLKPAECAYNTKVRCGPQQWQGSTLLHQPRHVHHTNTRCEWQRRLRGRRGRGWELCTSWLILLSARNCSKRINI